jgi:glycosyltransferase involved in cell wall biosynthesis
MITPSAAQARITAILMTDPAFPSSAAALALASQDHSAFDIVIAGEAVVAEARARALREAAGGVAPTVLALPAGLARGEIMNRAVLAASGDFVVFLRDDEAPAPDYLRQAAATLAAHPEIDVLFGDERRLGAVSWRQPARDVDLRGLLHHDHVSSACVWRTAAITACGGFDADLGGYAPWDLKIRLALGGRRIAKQADLCVYRRAPGSPSPADAACDAAWKAAIVKKHEARYGAVEVAWANAVRATPPGASPATGRFGTIPSTPAEAAAAGFGPKLGIVWEGSQFVTHSLALINRELALRQISRGHEVSLELYENHEWGADVELRFRALAERFDRRLPGPVDVHVRHQWPPRLDAPAEGRWVVIQPWEWGSTPKAWIEPFSAQVDEIWVPSRFVRSCYMRSGIPAERIQVIPNGVDLGVFRPHGEKLPLRTRKTVKLLFVGGTIRRKGVDVLLAAYTRAFSAADDVCLVIKDLGSRTFYKGQTHDRLIDEAKRAPGAAEIEHLVEPLDHHLLAALYRSADALVHPYRGEGFGLPILEAMASGLPVVVTGYGPALEFADPDCAYFIQSRELRTGARRVGDLETVEPIWLAEPDVDDLARHLRRIYENRAEARAKGARGAERARAYSWDEIDRQVQDRLAVVAARAPRRWRETAEPARSGANAAATALVAAASAQRRRGERLAASATIDEALDRDPRNAAALVFAFESAHACGLWDEAAHYLTRALAAAPRDPLVLAPYIRFCAAMGHESGAIAALQTLEAAAPDFPELGGLQKLLGAVPVG